MDQESDKAIQSVSNEQDQVNVIVTEVYPLDRSNLNSLIRLIIGGVTLGYEELMIRLNNWENLIEHQLDIDTQNLSDSSIAIDKNQVVELETKPQDSEEGDRLKFAFFGLLFEGQHNAIKGLKAFDKGSRNLVHAFRPIIKPFTSNRFLKPLVGRYNRLALRGQDEVESWINSGRIEYQHSYRLAKTAFQSTVNETINELADKPEIQNLIQTQSVGLASEVVEETRERSVTADNFIEDILRALLRKPLRSELPPPPLELREKAINLQVPK